VSELAASAPADKVIAVLPLLDSEGGVRRLGVLAAEEMERELLARKRKLTDRQHLNAVLGERDLQLSMLSTSEAAKRTGELTGADLLLVGTITEGGQSILISARLLSAASGQPIAISHTQTMPLADLRPLLWYVRRPAGENASGELPPLSLRCEFVSPEGTGETALADGATVVSGQRFKVRVQPNSDCYLYVLLYDSEGRASVLFPHGKIGLANDVRGGVSYEIPEGSKWYWFDNTPGTEVFYIVACYTPLKDLDLLLVKMQQAGEQQLQAANATREHIDKVITRGMSAGTSEDYQPKGMTVRTRGVGGIVDVGWGTPSTVPGTEMDNIINGHATVVKKIVLQHR
jgi:hypothetical protein